MLIRPVFIVGHPRSGTSLLRSCLERSSELWTIGREGRPIWEKWLHPRFFGWRSNEVRPDEVNDEVACELRDRLLRACRLPLFEWSVDDRVAYLEFLESQGANPYYYDLPLHVLQRHFPGPMPEGPPSDEELDEITPFCFFPPSRSPTEEEISSGIRMLEKSIQSCFRIPMIRRIFPDAKFVFIVRDARTAIASLITAWLHPRKFFSYRMPIELDIEGYSDRFPWGRRWWNLSLPPGWRDVADRPIEEVCANSWLQSNLALREQLPDLEAARSGLLIRYEDLIASPRDTLSRVVDVLELSPRDVVSDELPLVMTESHPDPDKWRRFEQRINHIVPLVADLQAELGYPTGN